MESDLSKLQAKGRERLFSQLLHDILEKRIQPEDEYEIAAYLESVGWNDERAAEMFGVENIFELAAECWAAINVKISAVSHKPHEKAGILYSAYDMAKSFLRGLIFALPMAISVIAMLTLKFSLWSYEYLSTELATCIAIGTILSFMTVGGFTQAIARRGFFYVVMGFYGMARRIIFMFLKIGGRVNNFVYLLSLTTIF